MARKILITAALPYANGPIHIGHMVEYVQADIWARYHRLVGNECLYICADDAHGTPIMLRAQKEGIEPAQLIADMKVSHEADFADFRVQFDHFHSTHSEENRRCATRIYERLREGGHIKRRVIEQAYDPEAEMFLPDRFIKGTCPKCETPDQYGDSCEACGSAYSPTELIDPKSVVSGATPIRKESEHLFFALGDFEDMLKEWVNSGRLQESVSNKLNEWFEAGLQDWDISRDAPYWGFEIPDAPGKYFYVWMDAPIGYQASHLAWCEANGGDWDAVWQPGSEVELYHFIGKDISYFHNLFWPAMLHGAGMRTPTAVYVHGFLLVDGRKMSKSRGTFVNARTYLDFLPPEALRFYIASKLNSRVEDIDLALDDFVFRVNAELVNKVINIASRCGTPLFKRCAGRLSDALPEPEMYAEVLAAREEIAQLYEEREYGKVVRRVSELADLTNKYIDEQAPWALFKDDATVDQGQAVCTQALNHFRALITYLAPIVPSIAEGAFAFLQAELSWAALDAPLLAHDVAKYEGLMYRIDRKKVDAMIEASRPAEPKPEQAPAKKKKAKKAEPAPPPAEIAYEQLMQVELRVGKVLAAQPVEGADKLLQLTVDIGQETPRNIFAGIKAWYSAEEVVGRLVVVAANLAPRKMRFGVSEGMVMAADDGRPFLISPDAGAGPGMRIR